MSPQPADYTALTDQQLLSLLAKEDAAAFKALYTRHIDFLYRAAMKRLPVAHKVEDIIQDIFLDLYKRRTELAGIMNLQAWLYNCLRNRIFNEIRNFISHEEHHARIAAQYTTEEQPVTTYDMKLLENGFHKALSQLTDRCREVFLLSRVEQLPNKKIAEQLDVSIKAVEKHIGKALQVIRRELSEPG